MDKQTCKCNKSLESMKQRNRELYGKVTELEQSVSRMKALIEAVFTLSWVNGIFELTHDEIEYVYSLYKDKISTAQCYCRECGIEPKFSDIEPRFGKTLVFHGGCCECKSQETLGIKECFGCQYINANWELPNKIIK